MSVLFRRTVPIVVLLVLSAHAPLALGQSSQAANPVGSGATTAGNKPPNVVILLADDMGFSDLGCYGGEIATPNLDALAQNGVRFTQFYNTARCWPTRGALLTGYYAQQIRRDALPGVGGGVQGVRPPWARLLPELLKSAGYRSYHSGKWHVDGPVLKGGFDRSLWINNDGNYFTARGNLLDDRPIQPAADETGYYVTRAIIDHAIECAGDHAAEQGGKPFFQYIPFIAPHFPLHALPEDIARYRDKYLDGWEKAREERFGRQQKMGLLRTTLSPLERQLGPRYPSPESMRRLGQGEVGRAAPWGDLTDEQRRFQATKMAIHAAMIDRMDREIGRYVEKLKELRLFDDTLILFASDNGASSEIIVRHGGHDPLRPPGSAETYLCLGPGFASVANTPFRRHKAWVHEGGISTPLIAHWPRGIRDRNRFRETPAHVIDIAPTILELAGVRRSDGEGGEAPPPFTGKSLAPALAADVTIARDSLWWLHEGNRALRVGDWKIVAGKGEPWELYDLRTDRAEQHNLAEEQKERVKEMEKLWQQQTESFVATVQTSASGPAPPTTEKRPPAKAGK